VQITASVGSSIGWQDGKPHCQPLSPRTCIYPCVTHRGFLSRLMQSKFNEKKPRHYTCRIKPKVALVQCEEAPYVHGFSGQHTSRMDNRMRLTTSYMADLGWCELLTMHGGCSLAAVHAYYYVRSIAASPPSRTASSLRIIFLLRHRRHCGSLQLRFKQLSTSLIFNICL
jgi:hypothetical protein